MTITTPDGALYQAGEGAGPPAAGLRGLVVDDEYSIRFALRDVLGELGLAVSEAATLASAAAACADGRFDLIVLDKNLPDGNGLELARQFAGRSVDCAVVLMTAYASLGSAIDALRSGVVDYLIKPFELSDVQVRLRRVLETQSLARANRALLQELQQKTAYLESLVVRDPLTQLFNHVHFHESLERELARCRRHGLRLAVVLLDVDEFKQVNDTLGHLTGDAVLRSLGELLRESSRRTDLSFRLRENDIAARFGGDEFALVLPDTTKVGAAAMAERLRQHVAHFAPEVEGVSGVTISLGVAAYPDDAADREGLVRAVDVAMYAAKRAGRNRLVTYQPGLAAGGQVASLEAAKLTELERVLAAMALKFDYQPIVDLKNGSVLAYEALCRPEGPVFSGPCDLIVTAEHAGRMCELGRVLRARALQPLDLLPEPLLLFVNLHPHELFDPLLVEGSPALRDYAHRLVLEVTEASAITDFGRARDAVAQLRGYGFRIALDDLGSGYAGLNCLAVLAPDYVKLDITMVHSVRTGERSARLIRHLLDFARGEGMQVIAEGIETRLDLDLITGLGVPLGQGFHLAMPAPPFVGGDQIRWP
jgi:diguanylate cyclase (GGDEF)-like protein